MAEQNYELTSKEVPVRFHGQSVRFWEPERIENPSDEQVAEALRQMYVDNQSIMDANLAAYRLDRQKAIKELLNKENATIEGVQAEALKDEFRKTKRRLRGTGGSGTATKGVSKKKEAEITRNAQAQTYRDLLANPALDPATRATIEGLLASLDAAGVQVETPTENAGQTPADDPQSPPAEKSTATAKAGKGK